MELSSTINKDSEMEFSSDESDVEQESSIVFREISSKVTRLFVKNRSLTLTGFQNLPPEIMYHILKFVDVVTLMSVLKFVSRYFYDFLSSSEFWEMRLADCLHCSQNNSHLKISDCELEHLNKIGMPRSIHEIETAKSLSYSKSLSRHVSSSNHYGDIHCVKMLSYPATQLALSGSRDKTICVYNTTLLKSPDSKCVINTNTDHNGWIWTLDQEDGNSSKIASGSWDSYVHIYDMGYGEMEKVSVISVHSAILCTRFEQNFLLYGTYSKYIAGYDIRAGMVAFKLKHHTKPVLSIASSPSYLWSTGEDHALACYDRRAGKLLKRIKLDRISSSIQYHDPYLWVAGYDGFVKCFNKEMKLVNKFYSGHTLPITDMTHCTGATVTASKDGKVKVFSPNISSVLWNSFSLDNAASCVDYKDGILMAGCCDSTVSFWKNKLLV